MVLVTENKDEWRKPKDNKVKKIALLVLISLYACQPADQEQNTSKVSADATKDIKPAALAKNTTLGEIGQIWNISGNCR